MYDNGHPAAGPETLTAAYARVLVDGLVGSGRVIAMAEAMLATQITELSRVRQADAAADAAGAGGAGRQFLLDREAVERAIADEVAVAMRWSPLTALRRVAAAVTLVEGAPATLAALAAGRIDAARAYRIAEGVAVLSPEAAARVEAVVLPVAERQTPAQVAAGVRRAVIAADPEAASRAYARAEEARHSRCRPEDDGMASIWVTGTADRISAAWQTATAVAQHRVDLAAATEGAEPITLDQARADSILDMLSSPDGLDEDGPPDTCSSSGSSTGSGTGSGGCSGCGCDTPGVNVTLLVPAATLADPTAPGAAPAELSGPGIGAGVPIAAAQLHDILGDAPEWLAPHLPDRTPTAATLSFQRWITDARGVVTATSSRAYRPSPALAATVKARDTTCRFPGCRVRAVNCDIDHTIPHPRRPHQRRQSRPALSPPPPPQDPRPLAATATTRQRPGMDHPHRAHPPHRTTQLDHADSAANAGALTGVRHIHDRLPEGVAGSRRRPRERARPGALLRSVARRRPAAEDVLVNGPGHVVLADTPGEPYFSMRDRPTPRAERYAIGRALRERVHRSALGAWAPAGDRADPVSLVERAHEGREERLVPIRVGRMIASPYGFLRGAAIVMAADCAALPATGITPVICGDAHVGNFGFYGSPERELVLDLNDFDEAHPGPWEWDLRRLTASIWVAGRQNGLGESTCEAAVTSCSASYREQVRRLAEQPLLQRSFERLDLDRLLDATHDRSLAKAIERAAGRARNKTSDRALPRFTRSDGGERRIVEEPPLITRLDPPHAEALAIGLDDYLTTLAPHWRRLLGGYTVLDMAHKVVGVGSVGLRAYVALCEGSSPDDVLFLQLKQARRSVIAPYVHGDNAWHAHQGQRVVEYQQALQTVSDPLLGWTTVAGRQFYVRQFRNMKGSLALDAIGATAFVDYVGICGKLLAKGHARTSGASMIAGYVGGGDQLDLAMCRFARAYADQTEADHGALVAAVRAGRLAAERGV